MGVRVSSLAQAKVPFMCFNPSLAFVLFQFNLLGRTGQQKRGAGREKQGHHQEAAG